MAIAESLPRAQPRLAALAGATTRMARRWLAGEPLATLPDGVRAAEALHVPVHALSPTPTQRAREGLAALAGQTGPERRTWSIRQVSDHLRCSASYYHFRHVAAVPEAGRVELAVGHAVHRAIDVREDGSRKWGVLRFQDSRLLPDAEAVDT